MTRARVKVVAGSIVLAALVGGGATWAGTRGEDDKPLEGEARNKAIAAALANTGGGTVTETEVGDAGAAYSVEVRLGNGEEVEVELDRSFHVIRSVFDDNSRGDTNEEGGQ